MPNLQYSREYSQFPEQVIHMRTFKDPDNSKAAIIEQIEQLKKSGNYTGAAELLRNNPDLIDYAVQSDDVNTIIEEVLNAQLFARHEKQNLFYTPMDCDYITKTRPFICHYANNTSVGMPYNYIYITSETDNPVFYAPFVNDNPITNSKYSGVVFFSDASFSLIKTDYLVGQHEGGTLYGYSHKKSSSKMTMTVYSDSIPSYTGQGLAGGYTYGVYHFVPGSYGKMILDVGGIDFNHISTGQTEVFKNTNVPTASAVNTLLLQPLLTTLPRFYAEEEDVWISNEAIDYEVGA